MHPYAHISPLSSVMVLSFIYGLMYISVPTKEFALLLLEYILRDEVYADSYRANPKSLVVS